MIARIASVLALTVLFAGGLGVGTTAAQDAEAVPTVLTVDVEVPDKAELDPRVVATLKTEEGAPVTGAAVSMYAAVELLGERQAFLGTATTDATGTARVPLTPRHPDYRIVATYAGDAAHAAARNEQAVTFPDGAVEPFAHVHGLHGLLQPVRDLMPQAISLAVGLLWIGLIALTVVTVRTIRNDTDVTRDPELLKETTP